jgi:hypothetical protein
VEFRSLRKERVLLGRFFDDILNSTTTCSASQPLLRRRKYLKKKIYLHINASIYSRCHRKKGRKKKQKRLQSNNHIVERKKFIIVRIEKTERKNILFKSKAATKKPIET